MNVALATKPKRKQSYWRLVWRQFRRGKMAMASLVVLVLIGVTAVIAPFLAHEKPLYMKYNGKTYWAPNVIDYEELNNFRFDTWTPGDGEIGIRPIVPHSPERSSLPNRLEGPSKRNWLGTDDRGRDVLSRIIWGTRISMSVGFVAVGIYVTIGVVMGAFAGYYRGTTDVIILRVIEVMMCFPPLILILAIVALLPPSIYNIMVAIGIVRWTDVARLVRGEFLKLRESDFATAARATGLRDLRIIFRHLLPNALAPVLVSATFGVAAAIILESALSFLGLGVPPPTASWGEILSQSKRYVDEAWWLIVFPGAAIFVTVTTFNLVGEGLRDAMDPRLRE